MRFGEKRWRCFDVGCRFFCFIGQPESSKTLSYATFMSDVTDSSGCELGHLSLFMYISTERDIISAQDSLSVVLRSSCGADTNVSGVERLVQD
jgi:hypothetical protein